MLKGDSSVQHSTVDKPAIGRLVLGAPKLVLVCQYMQLSTFTLVHPLLVEVAPDYNLSWRMIQGDG